MVRHRSELELVWESLVRLFPASTLLIDFFVNPSSYRFLGTNLVAGPVADPRSRQAAEILSVLGPEDRCKIADIAALNVDRTARAFNAVAVAYVTLPFTVGALASDVAPEMIRDAIRTVSAGVLIFLAAAAATPIYYFFGAWRARQLKWTIDLIQLGMIEVAGGRTVR